jgi:Ribose/xylose/arabinose/galactoside ABC-type transport systems, permease components
MEKLKNLTKQSEFKRKIVIVIALIVLLLAFGIINPAYLSYNNIMTILLATSTNGLLAFAVSWPIMTAGIDISVGTVMTFSCVLSGVAFNSAGLPIGLCIILGILVGTFCGFLNGFMSAKLGLPPMIASLAMQMITKGLSLVISGCKPVYFTGCSWYQKIATGNFLGINGFYNAIIILLGMCVVSYIIFSKTIFGRYTLAIGSNAEATRLSGINTDNWQIGVYTLCGTYAGIAGLVLSSRLNSAQPALGLGYEMDAIAAAVIGGNSLMGGEGTIIGTLIGALIISSLQNGLRIMQISTETQYAIIGVVLILTVAFDQRRKKRKKVAGKSNA